MFNSGEGIAFVIAGTKRIRQSAQISIVGLWTARWFLLESLLFRTGQSRLQGFRYRSRYFAFNTENVLQFAVVALSPKMLIRCRANKLHVDVHLVGCFLHAAFENVGDTKLTSNLTQIARPRGILLRRGIRDHLKRSDLREAG